MQASLASLPLAFGGLFEPDLVVTICQAEGWIIRGCEKPACSHAECNVISAKQRYRQEVTCTVSRAANQPYCLIDWLFSRPGTTILGDRRVAHGGIFFEPLQVATRHDHLSLVHLPSKQIIMYPPAQEVRAGRN